MADKLKLTKGDIRYCFFKKRREMRLKRLSKAHKNWKLCCCHCASRGTTGQNPKGSSQNDPGLPEALGALKTLTLSSGHQSRGGGS